MKARAFLSQPLSGMTLIHLIQLLLLFVIIINSV